MDQLLPTRMDQAERRREGIRTSRRQPKTRVDHPASRSLGRGARSEVGRLQLLAAVDDEAQLMELCVVLHGVVSLSRLVLGLRVSRAVVLRRIR